MRTFLLCVRLTFLHTDDTEYVPNGKKAKKVTVSIDGQTVPANWVQKGADILVSWQNRMTVKAGGNGMN
jgi:hypothetical protein